ncbi:putative Glycosyl hydrolase family 17 protein [Phytophthora cinnamomi]|uniref:putative Glycosyl hydrolase family 17 protein n=1 Tax=Phytophthora cinnamomi TaxID=4785 RepID=UPI003559EC75|nr:putative Glycosyl hydrolase family 17 protein [Phytophthora cinnamomi]
MLSFKLLGAIVAFTSALLTKQSAAQFCIHGINYNPRNGPDWAAEDQRCKSSANIQADISTLAQVSGSIRLYGLGDCDQVSSVVPVAINAGLSVSLGLWVSGDETVFEAEFNRLQTLIQQSPGIFTGGSIVDIHVGSEAVYRKDITAEKNIEYLQRVKSLLAAYSLSSVPATIAEIGDVYLAHPELTNAVDFVQANGFPFWEKIAVEDAVEYFDRRMTPLYQQAAALGKRVEIGETGWASGGSSPKASEASPENAARYFFNFYQMAKARSLPFYYFEGFDEEWKIGTSNASVEGYFGLFHEDRTLKTEIANLALGPSCPAGRNEDASASNTGSSTSGSQATDGSAESTPATVSPGGCRVRRV